MQMPTSGGGEFIENLIKPVENCKFRAENCPPEVQPLGGGIHRNASFPNGFQGFPPLPEFVFASPIRQNVVLLTVSQLFYLAGDQPLGGGIYRNASFPKGV